MKRADHVFLHDRSTLMPRWRGGSFGTAATGKSRQRGFSLLEMIAAILLLAVAFGALMRVAETSLDLTNHAAEYSKAALWAQSKLDSAEVTDTLQLGESEGRFDKAYRWKLQVTPWSPPLPNEDIGVGIKLYKLDLRVLWGERQRARAADFSTLRAVVDARAKPMTE
jgi:general secretion pathway protein I